MSKRSFKITRVYVVPAAGKTEARDVLSAALAGKSGDPEAYLDFESVREVIPEPGKSWRSEFRDQLFGTSSPVKQPATNGSQS